MKPILWIFLMVGLHNGLAYIVPIETSGGNSGSENGLMKTEGESIDKHMISVDRDLDLGEIGQKWRLHLDISLQQVQEVIQGKTGIPTLSSDSKEDVEGTAEEEEEEAPPIQPATKVLKSFSFTTPVGTSGGERRQGVDVVVTPGVDKWPRTGVVETSGGGTRQGGGVEYPNINKVPVSNPCNPNPCYNDGECLQGEDPYGWGFYCWCSGSSGGRRCQIRDPCNQFRCPEGTICRRTYSDDRGRFCYNRDTWDLIDV